jgi:hypothetical protein
MLVLSFRRNHVYIRKGIRIEMVPKDLDKKQVFQKFMKAHKTKAAGTPNASNIL